MFFSYVFSGKTQVLTRLPILTTAVERRLFQKGPQAGGKSHFPVGKIPAVTFITAARRTYKSQFIPIK
ncbi:MAG: hypothetical protein CVU77_02005 [Elusimicrobia bacterium HGW-Elusimicrobia-1]|nr:MAG: hypothetical protein CVU77_02005 [Elusimicrobia bacterium HGW-Elusimicrobia-1]